GGGEGEEGCQRGGRGPAMERQGCHQFLKGSDVALGAAGGFVGGRRPAPGGGTAGGGGGARAVGARPYGRMGLRTRRPLAAGADEAEPTPDDAEGAPLAVPATALGSDVGGEVPAVGPPGCCVRVTKNSSAAAIDPNTAAPAMIPVLARVRRGSLEVGAI